MRMQNVRFIKPNSLFHPKESSTLISTIIDYLFEIHPMLDKVYVCVKFSLLVSFLNNFYFHS